MTHETGESSSSDRVEDLMRDLGSPDPEARLEAAHALGELGQGRAVRHLVRLLNDEDTRVQATVARALGEIEDREALVPLLEVACDVERESSVRRASMRSLQKLGYRPQERKPDWMAPLIMYGLGAALLAASVAFSTVIGPFAAIVFFVGLGLLVIYWAKQVRTSGGAWYTDSEGGDPTWIPGEPSDPGAGFGGDGGGNAGGAA